MGSEAIQQPSAFLLCSTCQKPFELTKVGIFGEKMFCQGCSEYWFRKGELAAVCFRNEDFPNFAESHAFAENTTISCPECLDKLLEKIPFDAEDDTCVMCCPQCKGLLINKNVLGWIRRWKPAEHWHFFGLEKFITNPNLVHLMIFPFATFFPYISKLLVFPEFLMQSALMAYHEAGHAIMSWSTGRVALPTIAVTFSSNVESTSFSIALMILLAVGAYFMLENYLHLALIMGLEVSLIGFATFATSLNQRMMLISFAGVAGEFILPTVLVIFSFYKMPEFLGWNRWRYVAMFFGYYGIAHAYGFWREIAAGIRPLPMGSLIQGANDANGDMQKLLNDGGWSVESLISNYVAIGYVCFALIWINYLYLVYVAYQESREEKSDSGPLTRPPPSTLS